MNKYFKSALCVLLAVVMLLSIASCGKKKTSLDLSLFPLVYADENGLQAIKEGEKEPKLITKNFYTYLNSDNKVQAASDGNIYFIETESKTKTIGDLYSYSVTEKNEKKRKQLVHSGTYSYKVSHDASCIMINNGSGNLFKYDEKLDKKGEYSYIQSSGVTDIIDISADGKYVLYSQVLKGTRYQCLTIAKTDFKTTDELEKRSAKERLANKDINKAPVIISQYFRHYIGASDDLSAIYFSTAKVASGGKSHSNLYIFKNYKELVKLATDNYETYFVNDNGELLYSVSVSNAKKLSDIIVDKYAKADKKLNSKTADKKKLKAKSSRDKVRKTVNDYLKGITTTGFYKMSKSLKEAELIKEISGQTRVKGTDADDFLVIAYATDYNFSAAKKVDINKVKTVYSLFTKIKSKKLYGISTKKVFELKTEKGVEYSNSDCFVDYKNNKFNFIANFNYLAKKESEKSGTLYSVTYTNEEFGKPTKISDGAALVAHFISDKDYYFVTASSVLVKNNVKTPVLKDYSYSSNTPEVPIVFSSISTGKKNKYGMEQTKDTAYMISNGKTVSIGKIFNNKPIVIKDNMFAFYTDFDYKSSSGAVTLFNGKELVTLGKKVGYIYSF